MKTSLVLLTTSLPVAAWLLLAPEVAAHDGEPGHDHGALADPTAPSGDPTAPSGDPTAPSGDPSAPSGDPTASLDVTDDPDAADPGAALVASDPSEPEPAGTTPPEPLAPPPETAIDPGFGRAKTFRDTTWRRSVRESLEVEEPGMLDPAHFYFEIRFGPYTPQVDEEPGLTGAPYATYFGDSPQFYFGLELDWLPLYIPYVASIGPGFGWGFTRASGNTRLEADPTQEAESETDLTIFPMHVSAVVRFDGLLREAHVPIVPYGKIGYGFGVWSVSAPGDNSVGGVSSEGTSTGLHAAVGGALALNAFDPSAAMSMSETTGIRYAYLYGEWMGDFLGSLGGEGQMYVGTSTVVVGLAVEF